MTKLIAIASKKRGGSTLHCSGVGLVIIGKEDANMDIRKSSGGTWPMTNVRSL